MQRYRIGRAYIDGAGIRGEDVLRAHDVWNHHEHQFVVLPLFVLSGEEITEERYRSEPRDAVDRLALRFLKDSAHDVGFAFTHADLMVNLSLTDDRLLNATDVHVGVDGGNVHRDFQRDLIGSMTVRRHINVHANVDVVELCINQRIDADAADAGLERSGSYRHALPDLERGLLAVQSTNLRLLQDLCITVVVQERRRRRGDGYLKVSGIEVRKAVEVDRARRASGRCGCSPVSSADI